MIFLQFCAFLLGFQALFGVEHPGKNLVLSVKKIQLAQFPRSYNPSLLKTKKGYLLTFRYTPDAKAPWFSEIGLVELNAKFDPISEPYLLQTRFEGHRAPPQAEDARLIAHQDKIYLLYNDNVDTFVHKKARRDMHIAELSSTDQGYVLQPPQKLVYSAMRHQQKWEKNWIPFIHENNLHLVYSVIPHEILMPNLENGHCHSLCKTDVSCDWSWGTIHGGTTAQLVDGEYLAFFHSNNKSVVKNSDEKMFIHYYIGAYTFSSTPPFNVTRISKEPIKDAVLNRSQSHYRVLFPSGYVAEGSKIFLVVGKDDCEMALVTIDKALLLKSLKRVP